AVEGDGQDPRARLGADHSALRSAAPQVSPEPKASDRTRCPGRMVPPATDSDRRIGMLAAVVLPTRWMFDSIFSGGSFSTEPTVLLMLRLAWCGTTQSMSPSDSPLSLSASRAAACMPARSEEHTSELQSRENLV